MPGTDDARTVVRRALVCVAVIAVCDALSDLVSLGTPGLAVLDEPAHFATALLLLTVGSAVVGRAGGSLSRPLLLTALACSVLIDVDHVPQTLFSSTVLSGSLGRPYTHSLLTILVAVGLALLIRRPPARRVLLGVALGVALHFVRDLFTGPGLALAWPLSSTMVRLPYVLYWGVLGAALLVGLLVLLRRPERTSRAPRLHDRDA